MHLSVCPAAHLPICLSVCRSARPSVSQCVYLTTCARRCPGRLRRGRLAQVASEPPCTPCRRASGCSSAPEAPTPAASGPLAQQAQHEPPSGARCEPWGCNPITLPRIMVSKTRMADIHCSAVQADRQTPVRARPPRRSQLSTAMSKNKHRTDTIRQTFDVASIFARPSTR
jgi:hypothetical protein